MLKIAVKKKTFQLQLDGKQYSITTSNVVNKMEKKTIRECKEQTSSNEI